MTTTIPSSKNVGADFKEVRTKLEDFRKLVEEYGLDFAASSLGELYDRADSVFEQGGELETLREWVNGEKRAEKNRTVADLALLNDFVEKILRNREHRLVEELLTGYVNHEQDDSAGGEPAGENPKGYQQLLEFYGALCFLPVVEEIDWETGKGHFPETLFKLGVDGFEVGLKCRTVEVPNLRVEPADLKECFQELFALEADTGLVFINFRYNFPHLEFIDEALDHVWMKNEMIYTHGYPNLKIFTGHKLSLDQEQLNEIGFDSDNYCERSAYCGICSAHHTLGIHRKEAADQIVDGIFPAFFRRFDNFPYFDRLTAERPPDFNYEKAFLEEELLKGFEESVYDQQKLAKKRLNYFA